MEELLCDLLAPLLAQLPGSAGVANVCTLQGHLQDKEEPRTSEGAHGHTSRTPEDHPTRQHNALSTVAVGYRCTTQCR